MISIGTDIVEIARIEASYERLGQPFASRILTPFEQTCFSKSRQPINYLAKRFAAKEAIAKALGTGIARGVSWQHIEISNDPETGAPICQLLAGAAARMAELGGSKVLLSLSDEKNYALAYAAIV